MYGLVPENDWRKLHNFEQFHDAIRKSVDQFISRLEPLINCKPENPFRTSLDTSDPNKMLFSSCFGIGRLVFNFSSGESEIEGKLIFERQIFNSTDEPNWEPTLAIQFPAYENPYIFTTDDCKEALPLDRIRISGAFDNYCFAFFRSMLYTQIEGKPQKI